MQLALFAVALLALVRRRRARGHGDDVGHAERHGHVAHRERLRERDAVPEVGGRRGT